MIGLLLVCLFGSWITVSAETYIYEEKYVEVPVDHFSFANNATFRMRYLYNDTYWAYKGPIFFYPGNEGAIEMFAQNTGFMWAAAREFGALVIFAEHRYYGKSMPFGNMSLTEPKYSGYLTSSQAMADYVYLLDLLQKTTMYMVSAKRQRPVIAFGGSYGGMLAAWMRMKYPSTILGAIASSAPIFQFSDLTPCDSFNRIVTTDFKSSTDGDCTILIQRSWETIKEIAVTSAGKGWISNTFKLCEPLQSNEQVERFLDWISQIYGNVAMINYPYPTDFLNPVPGYPVREVCERLLDTSLRDKALVDAVFNAISVYTNYTGQTKCNALNSTSGKMDENAWDFQACTELIMPFCSTDNDMFENEAWDFEEFSEACYKRWGVKMLRPDVAVLEYGGKDLSAYSNIIFSNGLLDPWAPGGVLHDISDSVRAFIIPEAAHHLDLREDNPNDPESVRQARNFHRQTIRGWLKNYYESKSGRLY